MVEHNTTINRWRDLMQCWVNINMLLKSNNNPDQIWYTTCAGHPKALKERQNPTRYDTVLQPCVLYVGVLVEVLWRAGVLWRRSPRVWRLTLWRRTGHCRDSAVDESPSVRRIRQTAAMDKENWHNIWVKTNLILMCKKPLAFTCCSCLQTARGRTALLRGYTASIPPSRWTTQRPVHTWEEAQPFITNITADTWRC